MEEVSIKDQIKCVEREIAMREHVYPERVTRGLMSEKKAAQEINSMKAVLQTLFKHIDENLTTADKLESTSLYHSCIAHYNDFIKGSVGVGAKIDGVQGKAMKKIIAYLRRESKEKSDSGVLKSWFFILQNWHRVGDFIGKQKTLVQIDKNLIEILDKIRNGHDKKAANRNEIDQLELGLDEELNRRASENSTRADN